MRTNAILAVILCVLVGVYAFTGHEVLAPGGAAPRLFPDLNKEAVDRIVLEGGWLDTRYEYARMGSDWVLASAGGYPAKRETAAKLIDAVYNARAENRVGTSEDLRKETRTDAQGRLVSLYRGDQAVAELRIGKNPERGWQEFFVRKEDGDSIYRTRTLLTGTEDDEDVRGFSWTSLVQRPAEWIDTQIWDLGEFEAQEIQLARGGRPPVRLVREGQDQWKMLAPEEAAADADAAEAIVRGLRTLNCVDVLGLYDDVKAKYGLEEPETTLELILRKEKKKEKEPEEEGEGEGEEEEEEPEEPEYVVVRRRLYVGKAVTLPDYFDEESGEVKTKEYYPVAISGDFDDGKEKDKARYVYLVRDYTLSSLRKTVDELKQDEPEKEPEEGDQPAEGEEPAEGDEPAEGEEPEKPAEDEDKSEAPAEDEKPAEDEDAGEEAGADR